MAKVEQIIVGAWLGVVIVACLDVTDSHASTLDRVGAVLATVIATVVAVLTVVVSIFRAALGEDRDNAQ